MEVLDIINLRGVNKSYNQGEENEVNALRDVDLKVERGEMISIRGPSGSGKTTLLSIIGCVIQPTSGTAMISGKKISRLPDHFLTRYRRELIGFVFQNFGLLEYLSVFENVALPLLPLGLSPGKRAELIDPLLKKFSIFERRQFPINKVSGGELQRVALVRALVNDPPIIVADEPTSHLDSSLALEVMATFAGLKNAGKTVIISSHDPLVTEYEAVDRELKVVDGRLRS